MKQPIGDPIKKKQLKEKRHRADRYRTMIILGITLVIIGVVLVWYIII